MNDRLKAVGRKVAVLAAALMIVAAVVGGAGLLTTGDPMEYAPVEEGEAFGLSVGSVAVGMVVGGAIYGYLDGPDVNADKLAKQDAQEAETSMYEAANQMRANHEVIDTAYGNYLTDTKPVALMVGRNAYLRAIDNGNVSDVADARLEAREAVENYYAAKQQNLLEAQDVVIGTTQSFFAKVENNSQIDSSFVTIEMDDGVTGSSDRPTFNTTVTASLLNGSTEEIKAIHYDELKNCDACNPETTNVSILNPAPATGGSTYPMKGVRLQGPTDSYEPLVYGNLYNFSQKWEKIVQQNQAAQDEIGDIVNGTYSEIQAGELDTSDLVDPYVGMRNYDPTEDGESFSIRALSAMGVTPPENASDVGEMCVVVDGTERCGLLMSDGQPTVSSIARSGDTSGFYTSLAVDPVDGENQSGNVTIRLVDTDGTVSNQTITLPYDSSGGAATNPTTYETLDSAVDRVELSFSPENGNGVPEVRAIGEDGSNKTLVEADLLAEPTTKEGFRVGGSYDPSNISGPQFVVGSEGQQYELSERFSLANATVNGETLRDGDRVSYPDPDYDTASVEGYKILRKQLEQLQSEINARQQQTRNPGGGGAILGGFSLFGLSGLKGLLVLFFLAAAALALLSRV